MKNAPKYNSQELDKESGYYFYNARHYDPEIGRFVTADSVIDGELSTQGWNRYAYVHNNPIIYRDPTGHERQGLFGVADKIGDVIKTPFEGIREGASKVRDWIVDGSKPAAVGKALGVSLGLATVATAGAVAAPSALTAAGGKKLLDMAFGGVQGIATYMATTPANERTLKGYATSTAVGAATGLVSNVATGSKIISEAPAIVKAATSALTSGTGNYAGQRLSGKDNKDVSASSVAWAAVTSGFGSYLSSATNLSETASSLVGKGAMFVPDVSGAAMINMAEKELKK
jgi:RHS repeat-associated protein